MKKIVIYALTALVLLSVALLFGCQPQGTPAEEKVIIASDLYQITTHVDKDEDPFMAQDSYGVYWLIWCSDRSGNGDIWYSNSPDGNSWSNSMQLTSNTLDDWYPSMIQDSAGKFWIVWMSWRAGNYDVWYINYEKGGAWSDPVQLTKDTSDDWVPSLFQDSSGAYWITWTSGRSGNKDIWYTTSKDGENWSKATQLTTDASEDDCAWLMQDSKGTYWLVWHSNRQDRYDIFYTNSTDGINWSTPKPLISNKSTDMYPFLIQDSTGKYWIAWTSDRSDILGDVWCATSEDGHIWSTPIQVTEATSKDYTPRLMEDTAGIMWITWVSDRSGNLDIWYSKITKPKSGQQQPVPVMPTPTPTPSPSPPTPTPSVVGDSWQVTVENAREETQLTTSTREYTPKSGYTFLVVDAMFQNLDPTETTRVSSAEVAVITEVGETITAAGGGSQGEDYDLGYEYVAMSAEDPLFLSLVFIVKKETIDQVFKLRFREVPLIPFSVG